MKIENLENLTVHGYLNQPTKQNLAEIYLSNGDSDIINYQGATAHTLKFLYRSDVFTFMVGAAFGSPGMYYLGTVVEKIKFLPLLELGWRF